jgi:hypothetical protein
LISLLSPQKAKSPHFNKPNETGFRQHRRGKKDFRSSLYQAFHTPSAIDHQYALKVDYQRYYPSFAEVELLPNYYRVGDYAFEFQPLTSQKSWHLFCIIVQALTIC